MLVSIVAMKTSVRLIPSLLAIILLHPTLGLAQQVTGQDLDTVLARADKLLEEAKAAYEEGRSKSSVPSFVDAGFKLEDARIKYIVLQEIGSPEKQKIAGDRLRAVNQLAKLIHDGRVAISGAPAEQQAPKPPEAPPTPPPGEPATPRPVPPAKDPVDVTRRAAVPETAKQRDPEKLIKDLFKEQYAKRSQADHQVLAQLLLNEVSKNRNDLAVVWVLCREAQDQAVQAGDLPAAMKAIDTAAEVFDVDGMSMRNAALAAALKMVKTPEEGVGLVMASFKVIDELIANDQYDVADKLAASMLPPAKKSGNALVLGQLTTRAKDIVDAKALYQGMKSVLEKLAKAPDDPSANTEMGKFLCFVKGNWDLGLRFIVKGADLTLKPLAEKELATSGHSADLVALGDGWWDLGEKDKSPLRKSQMMTHAKALYEIALPEASGLLKSKIEKRLASETNSKVAGGMDELQIEYVAGEAPKALGIVVLRNLRDGACADAVQIGKPVIKTAGKLVTNCLYFNVADSWTPKGMIEITVTYLDQSGTVYIDYNEKDSQGQPKGIQACTPFAMTNTGAWKTFMAKLPSTGLNNLMHGADFRVVVNGPELSIQRISLKCSK